jgi:hypothetical protein
MEKCFLYTLVKNFYDNRKHMRSPNSAMPTTGEKALHSAFSGNLTLYVHGIVQAMYFVPSQAYAFINCRLLSGWFRTVIAGRARGWTPSLANPSLPSPRLKRGPSGSLLITRPHLAGPRRPRPTGATPPSGRPNRPPAGMVPGQQERPHPCRPAGRSSRRRRRRTGPPWRRTGPPHNGGRGHGYTWGQEEEAGPDRPASWRWIIWR